MGNERHQDRHPGVIRFLKDSRPGGSVRDKIQRAKDANSRMFGLLQVWQEERHIEKVRKPSNKQRKKGVDFFVGIPFEDEVLDLPIVVKGSAKGAELYRRTVGDEAIILVVHENRSDEEILNAFNIGLVNQLKRRRAEVAEVVNAPV